MRRLKAMPRDAALLFTDWTLLRMYPPLRHAWGWRGRQAEVRITGENAKRVLFGAINVRTGRRTLLRAATAGQAPFQAFLRRLRRSYGGREVWLLLDKGGAHTAAATRRLAAELRIELVWLPKQAPELNGMDQLWKELKRWVSANRQYRTIDRHAQEAEQWIMALSNKQAMRKAGLLSPGFWLRHFREDFWLPT